MARKYTKDVYTYYSHCSRIVADETLPAWSIVSVGKDEDSHPTVICRFIEKHYGNEYNSIS